MATYYWAGQNVGQYPGKNVNVSVLGSDAERRKVSWNNPANWLVQYSGQTTAAGGSFEIWPPVDVTWFEGASYAPGDGDRVVFDSFTYAGTQYPLSPCLFGGYWGDEGWLNAAPGATTGRVNSILITENWGAGASQEWPLSGAGPIYELSSSYRIGADETERTSVINDGGGYDYTGATMSGLRLRCAGFNNQARNGASRLSLVDSDITAYFSTASKSCQTFAGGTVNQCYIDSGAGLSGGLYQTIYTHIDDVHQLSEQTKANVTGYLYVGRLMSGQLPSGVDGSQYGRFVQQSDFTIPNVTIDTPHRPFVMTLDANATTVSVHPETRRGFGHGPSIGYQSLILGRWNSDLTITNLKLVQPLQGDQIRSVYSSEGVDQFAGYPILNTLETVGANNIVGVNKPITIENLVLEAGRFVLGSRFAYGTNGGGYVQCDLSANDRVQIDGGVLGSRAFLDLTHPSDATYKGVKIGAGVSHPSEDIGMQIVSEAALVRLPRDIKYVADYPSGETGPTFDVAVSNYPDLIGGFVKSSTR